MSKAESTTNWAERPKAATLQQAVQYAEERLERWRTTGYERDHVDAAYAVAMDDQRWGTGETWVMLVEACRELK